MTKCPRCFNPLSPDVFAWTEARPAKVEPDPVASAYLGHEVRGGEVRTATRPPDVGDSWTPIPAGFTEPVVILCPICHYELPDLWYYGSATCITLAGARYTGKTVFIAVLIKQLQQFAERLGREVVPANATTQERYSEEYERPLFDERGLLQPTPSAALHGSYQHEPLIFHLGRWGERARYLVIRDVAGEDMERGELGGRAWEFFALADAVFFLFDPIRVDEIAHQLRDLVPDSRLVGGDPREVLRRVLGLIGAGEPKLAVVLSKFDALQALSRVQASTWGRIMAHPGAAFNRDPGLVNRRYDEDDGRLLHAEVHSLLTRLEAGPLLTGMQNQVTGRHYDHRFFAVSALGETPEGDKLHRSGITPFRVLDPLRWVLADADVLQEPAW